MNLTLKAGDYFCVRNDSFLSKLIILQEWIKSLDHEATYSHAGVIVDSNGTTMESLRKVAHYDLQTHKGCKIIIARHKEMTPENFQKGYNEILKYNGKVYPIFRLVFHLLGIAKFLHTSGVPVCSELVVEHCYHAGLCDHDGYGWTPDNLADKMRNYNCYDVLYEGIL